MADILFLKQLPLLYEKQPTIYIFSLEVYNPLCSGTIDEQNPVEFCFFTIYCHWPACIKVGDAVQGSYGKLGLVSPMDSATSLAVKLSA